MTSPNGLRLSADMRIRLLERAAVQGEAEAARTLHAERARLGLTSEDADPKWTALLHELNRGPITKAARDLPQEHLNRLRLEHHVLTVPVGSRLVISLPNDRSRFHEAHQSALVRSARARRSAATRRQKKIEQGLWPKPLRIWKRPSKSIREALARISGELRVNRGVIGRSFYELQALTGLDEEDLHALLSALHDGRVRGWSITAAKFDEWVLTLGSQ